MDEERKIITLSDEEGNPMDFEFLDMIKYEGEEYIVLLPDDDEETTEILILKVDSDENGEAIGYDLVEDADTFNALFDIFKEKFKDEFNFLDN